MVTIGRHVLRRLSFKAVRSAFKTVFVIVNTCRMPAIRFKRVDRSTEKSGESCFEGVETKKQTPLKQHFRQGRVFRYSHRLFHPSIPAT